MGHSLKRRNTSYNIVDYVVTLGNVGEGLAQTCVLGLDTHLFELVLHQHYPRQEHIYLLFRILWSF